MDADKLSALIAESASAGDGDEPAAKPVADEPEGEAEPEAAAAGAESTESEEPAEPAPDAERAARVLEAIDSGDVVKLLEALGDKADDLLGGKAHRSLRVAAREIATTQKRLDATAGKLEAKYADQIAVRKACETGSENAFDLFADYVEKTTGRPWNDVVKWAAKAAIGRAERLTAQGVEKTEKETKRATAQAEVMGWVSAGIKGKAIAALPNAAQLVFDKIREKHGAGIDTPAKAIPLVLADLRKQHAALGKLLGKPEAKPAGRSPSSRTRVSEKETPLKRSTIEEDIAWAKQFVGRS